MLPAVGMAMIAGMAAKAIAAKHPGFAKGASMIAAPFIGLAYAVALPFIGMGMLLWTAAQAVKVKFATK
jgi:hypothetical protein